MIDARDYPSHDELDRAMRLEYYISELNAIDTNLARLKCAFDFYKNQYESQVKTLHYKKEMLENKINTLKSTD